MRGGLSLCVFNKLPKSLRRTSMFEVHHFGASILLIFLITESITLFHLQIIHMRNGNLSMSRSFKFGASRDEANLPLELIFLVGLNFRIPSVHSFH